jgi:hypothetical protein
MVVDWLLFPLVMLAVCLGCGLAVERVAGWRMWGGLLPAVGLCLVIVVATLTTTYAASARWTTPLVVLLALGGYASSWRRVAGLRPEPWPLAVSLALFAVFAAPVVLSGNASFAGYFIDNDAAFHFVLIDQLLSHGHDTAGLPPSIYSYLARSYLATSYPVGADVAVGALRPLVGQDIAWIYQPYLAVILTFGGVALYELLRDAVRPRSMRAVIAFIAAQAGLVYAFYLETSIKEIATTMILTVMVVLVFATLRERLRVRALVPLGLTAVAALDVLQLGAVPWIGIPLAVFGIAFAWHARRTVRVASRRQLVIAVSCTAVALVVLLLPVIKSASTFFTVATGVLTGTGGNSTGNLAGQLPNWEMLGIWPAGDFRLPILTHYGAAYALIGVALVSGVLGIAWMIRRRRLAPLLLVTGNGIAAIYLLSRGTAYANAKVMMIFSLTAVLAAMLGAASLYDSQRRVEAWVLAAAVAGGVLWTNVLAFENASIAPRQRLDELAAIGSRFSGQGPTLYNLADEFAAHFLRREAPADPAYSAFPARPGLPPRSAAQVRLAWDPNDLAEPWLQTFRLLVLGNDPVTSRPPANYRLVYQGRYYTVWRRTASPRVVAHVPISSGLDPSSAGCRTVRIVAAKAARERALIAYAPRPPMAILAPSKAAHPPTWPPYPGDPNELVPQQQSGVVTGLARVQQPGRYDVWLGGSFNRRYVVWVAKHPLGSVSPDIGSPGEYVRVGQVSLSRGMVPVLIDRPQTGFTPGETASTALLGPLVLVRSGSPPPVKEISPDQARSLCGRPLDWLEVVRPTAS